MLLEKINGFNAIYGTIDKLYHKEHEMGRPLGSKNKHPISLEARFWDKVDKKSDDECWEWQAFVHPRTGYGTIAVNRRMLAVHRVSWMLHYGDIPDGLFVCHHCDNRKCVNPKHLFLGTNQDNMNDMVAKGRSKPPDNKGERHGLSKLTEKQVIEIRNMYSAGGKNFTEIGALYNIDRRTIGNIVARRAWRHI